MFSNVVGHWGVCATTLHTVGSTCGNWRLPHLRVLPRIKMQKFTIFLSHREALLILEALNAYRAWPDCVYADNLTLLDLHQWLSQDLGQCHAPPAPLQSHSLSPLTPLASPVVDYASGPHTSDAEDPDSNVSLTAQVPITNLKLQGEVCPQPASGPHTLDTEDPDSNIDLSAQAPIANLQLQGEVCPRNSIPLPRKWCRSRQLSSANNHSAASLISHLAAANFDSVLHNVGAWAESLHHVFRQTRGMNHSRDTLEALVGRCSALNTSEVTSDFLCMTSQIQLAFKCQRSASSCVYLVSSNQCCS